MKLRKCGWLLCACGRIRIGRMVMSLIVMGLMGTMLGPAGNAQALITTTVQGTVYLANGKTGAGTLNVSWPAFSTANNQAVTAGRTTVTIAPDGFMSVNLAPNLGATPAGLYYTAIYHMTDGTTSTEYWVVPAAAQAALGQVRAQLMPAAQAVQAVSKAYVDQSIAELTGSLLTASGGTLSGPLYLNGDPTQALQAADKHYVDATFGLAVPLSGGKMTGPLTTPAVNGVQTPVAGSAQTNLQAAMNAAGPGGAMAIPPTYAGSDGFTNPNGIFVTDLRTNGSQQFERNVKEFGAVCDGTTDDTNALQAALNYAQTHAVALTIPQGTCKTRALNWHGESIGGLGKQVSALMGFPGQDVLATVTDSMNLLANTRLHDLTIYVDQSMDVSCAPALGRAPAGSCAVGRQIEKNSIFSPGGNGLTGTAGTGAAWAVGNCAIAMPAATGAGGNGLRVANIENLEIVATGVDPMAAQYPGAHSTHTCGLYLAQWPQWSEFRNIDIRGLNTGIAIAAVQGTTPAGLSSDSNRWQNITVEATHGFMAAAGSNNVLDNVVFMAGNSAATGEPPTGLVLDLGAAQQGWTVRNAVVTPAWNVVQPQLTATAAGGAVADVVAGTERGLGFDPYGAQVPLKFSGSCTAQAVGNVNSDGSIGTISVTQGGVGCSGTTTASVDVAGTWDTAAPVDLISGQNMTFLGGNLLKGDGGYSVWNATGSQNYGTRFGGGGRLAGGGAYAGLIANNGLGTAYQVDQFPGADFGAKLQACLGTVSSSYGGTCDARNFTGNITMRSDLTISTANVTVLLPCATISTANQMIVTAGTRNVALRGCALRGASNASGSQGGTVFLYSGTSAMLQVGDPTYAADTNGFHLDNVVINTTAANNSTTQALVAYRTQEMDLESLYFLGNSNQTGMTLDGTGNYTGGTFFDNALNGFQTAMSAIGHQIPNSATTDWMNASAFVRLHINCPTSGGSPIAGTYGINLAAGDGNTFTGGDVEGCDTAMHLGENARNNTIVGLRNENSNNQVVADAGSSYNNWMTGGTMFTGQLTDNGTRNSFLDSFHRSFNGMNGDWYGSQKDATVTNHFRIGIGSGNERGLLDRYQTDFGYRWTTGFSDATAGEQFYQVQDELNNVNRLSIGQYNNGQPSTNNQTAINAAGTGAVVLNGSNNAGTGGMVIGSGGANSTTVATINNAGNAQLNGTLQVAGTSTFIGTPTVKNQANTEIDATLWAGLTASQKESFIYKDWNGSSQWYMVKDASNNWALNSAVGGLDSFKAYQSTNSGDTYINASNPLGTVRINYESGSGAGFNIYGGASSTLYASFTAANAIKFPGLAAGSGHSCLQIDNTGYVTNTGSTCGSGSISLNGTVGTGNDGQIAYYAGSGTSIGGVSAVPLTAGGTGASTAAGALANMGAMALAGGTLTGPLNGTSANFAGNVAVGTTMATVPSGTLAAAEAQLPSGGTLVGSGILSVSTTHATPANISLNLQNGGGFNVASGQVLSINGPLTAGRYQIFFGTGTVSFASNQSIKEIYPEWWGAVPNAESTAAWQAAITAANNINFLGGTVSCPNAVYNISNTLTSYTTSTANGVSLLGPESQTNGAGAQCSLKWTGVAGGTMFHYLGGHKGHIRGIQFNGAGLASRGLWLDTSNGGTVTTSNISSIVRTGNVIAVTPATDITAPAGTNIRISGVSDPSFNGIFPVWYTSGGVYYVSQCNLAPVPCDGSTSATLTGGTVGSIVSGDTGDLVVEKDSFFVQQSQIVNLTSATVSAGSPKLLNAMLSAPIIVYPNQWIWITGVTGTSAGNYNGYWQVRDVQSPTTFTARCDQCFVDATGVSGTGTVYGPSTAMSQGANALSEINYSVYGTHVIDVMLDAYGEKDAGNNVIYPLIGFSIDGTANTKNFFFRDTTVSAYRIGWGNFATGGTFDCEGCGGTAIQDSVFASNVLGTVHIHDAEYEGNKTAYVLSNLISGPFSGQATLGAPGVGKLGQFEFPSVSGNGGSVVMDNMNFQNFGFAPDGVAISTTANLTLIGNYFVGLNNGTANQQVVTGVSLLTAGSGTTPIGTYVLAGSGGCASNAAGDAATNAQILVSVYVTGQINNAMAILDTGAGCVTAPTFTLPGSTGTFTVNVGPQIPWINYATGFAGRYSLMSNGNVYSGVPKGGWIPVIARQTFLYQNQGLSLNAYGGQAPSLTGIPVTSIGDKTSLGYNIYPLAQSQSATSIKFQPTPGAAALTAEVISSGTATLTTAFPHNLAAYQKITISGMASATCLNAAHFVVLASGLTANTFKVATVCADGSYTDAATATSENMVDSSSGMIQAPNNFPIIAARNSTQTGDDSLRWDASDNLQANINGTDYQIPYMVAGLLQLTNLPLATNSTAGVMRGDGSSISCTAGVCSASGSGAVPVYRTVGDTICAKGGDTTLGYAITGESQTGSGPYTVTMNVTSPSATFFYTGVPIRVDNYNGSTSGTGTITTVVAGASGSISFTSATNFGAFTAGGTIGLVCNNSVDSIYATTQFFSTQTTSLPIAANSAYRINVQWTDWVTATTATHAWKLNYGGATLFFPNAGVFTPAGAGSGYSGYFGEMSWDIFAPTGSKALATLQSVTGFYNAWNSISSNSGGPVSITSPQVFKVGVYFPATGVSSTTGTITYSGGATACTAGAQVVTFTNGGGTGALGTITISGTTPTGTVTITNTGQSYASIPTTGTVATCTGTATFSTGGTLAGAQGNAVVLYDLVQR